MDNQDSKSDTGTSDILYMEILTRQLEIYRTMAIMFYNRLDDKEKIDALTEVAISIREEDPDDTSV